VKLRRWCDVLLLSPISASTLSQLSIGLCTSLLASIVRCWDTGKTCLLAAALSDTERRNERIQSHIRQLQQDYCIVDETTTFTGVGEERWQAHGHDNIGVSTMADSVDKVTMASAAMITSLVHAQLRHDTAIVSFH